MDARSFDRLSRSLAAPTSRRSFLGSLAAIASGFISSRGTDAQVSQIQCGNQACASNPGSCASGCVCCAYTNSITGSVINSRCRPPGTCSPGTVACPPGQVIGSTGTCGVPTTTTTTTPPPVCVGVTPGTAECSGDSECQPGHSCLNGGCFQTCFDTSRPCSDGAYCSIAPATVRSIRTTGTASTAPSVSAPADTTPTALLGSICDRYIFADILTISALVPARPSELAPRAFGRSSSLLFRRRDANAQRRPVATLWSRGALGSWRPLNIGIGVF